MADRAEATFDFDEVRNLFGRTFNNNYTTMKKKMQQK